MLILLLLNVMGPTWYLLCLCISAGSGKSSTPLKITPSNVWLFFRSKMKKLAPLPDEHCISLFFSWELKKYWFYINSSVMVFFPESAFPTRHHPHVLNCYSYNLQVTWTMWYLESRKEVQFIEDMEKSLLGFLAFLTVFSVQINAASLVCKSVHTENTSIAYNKLEAYTVAALKPLFNHLLFDLPQNTE